MHRPAGFLRRKNGMHAEVTKVLFSEERIAARVKELGARITEDYRGVPLAVAGVLCGGSVFCADLIRRIDLPVALTFVRASSYGGGTAPQGRVKLDLLGADVAGRHVLVAEDIIDTGFTAAALKSELLARGALSVKLCCLLDKPSRRRADVSADYAGFTVPDVFVAGYGLDYDGMYRNLPYVGAVEIKED